MSSSAAARRAIDVHLGSKQVSRVSYGTIIGLALVAALEAHAPGPSVMVATLLATAIAVGLAGLNTQALVIGTIGGALIAVKALTH